MTVSNMWGRWTFNKDAWPEQTGCCPLTGRVYSINPIGSVYNVAAAKTVEDAERIVACVNACAGIPTYQLTDGNGNPVLLGEVIDGLRNDATNNMKANNFINDIYAVARDEPYGDNDNARFKILKMISNWYKESDGE